MEDDLTKDLSADDGMTRAVFDFGPPDETLDEAEAEPGLGTTSMRSEQMRLNRHFLEDAAPFEIDGFGQILESRMARLQLHQDPEWSLPLESVILIRGDRGSGKSCLLMNMMWRIMELYPQHHFLYYSFKRSKPDLFLRMILLGAQQVMPGKKGLDSHLREWRKLLMAEDPETLKRRSTTESPLSGLATLLLHGHRMHIVDRLGDIRDVNGSLGTFAKSFPLAVVFIDGGDWLLHVNNKGPGMTNLPHLLAQLRRTARVLGITIVMSLSDSVAETNGSSTLYEAVGRLREPWGGDEGALVLDWLEPGHNIKIEIPILSYNQRFVWNRLREADEIE